MKAISAKNLVKEGKANVQLIADASDPNMARLVISYTTGIINDYIKKMYPNLQIPMQIQPEVRMYFNEEMKSAYMFVPGVMALILMLISAMMTSISITREKELGTMEILLVSPLRPTQIIVGKVIPYLLLSVANAFIIVFIGNIVFGVPITGSFILLMLETILFIMMALCLGILISTAAKNQMTAMFISMIGLMLPTIILSGFIYPIENMPVVLQVVKPHYACPVFCNHHSCNYAKRSWNTVRLERNIDFNWNDFVFYWCKREEV